MSDDQYINDVISNYGEAGEDAVKIRAMCDELTNDAGGAARLSCTFVEINMIARRSDNKIIDYITENKETHLKALEIIVDKRGLKQLRDKAAEEELSDTCIEESQAMRQYRIAKGLAIIGELEEADAYIQQCYGIPCFFQAQLENSRKLYSESEFRDELVSFFLKEIEPRMSHYSIEKVVEVFRKR